MLFGSCVIPKKLAGINPFDVAPANEQFLRCSFVLNTLIIKSDFDHKRVVYAYKGEMYEKHGKKDKENTDNAIYKRVPRKSSAEPYGQHDYDEEKY